MAYSLRLPGVTDTAVTTVKELLAFATLPYYQVSGVLESGAGAVAIGAPVAWKVSTGKFIKFAASETAVTNEAVATGGAGTTEFWFSLANGHIKPGSVTLKIDGTTKTEGTDYSLDYDTGMIHLAADLGTGLALTVSYTWYENWEEEAGTCVGFVRIPGDSTSADAPIEVVIGGAVKYSVISADAAYSPKCLTDLGARYIIAADAVIF